MGADRWGRVALALLVALYLAIVNIIVDLRAQPRPQGQLHSQPDELRPSLMMLSAAGLSLLLGLVPRPFVTAATAAHEAIVLHPVVHH